MARTQPKLFHAVVTLGAALTGGTVAAVAVEGCSDGAAPPSADGGYPTIQASPDEAGYPTIAHDSGDRDAEVDAGYPVVARPPSEAGPRDADQEADGTTTPKDAGGDAYPIIMAPPGAGM